jgi:dTDP-4-amino-4,6-dideoxygalactose transaminase
MKVVIQAGGKGLRLRPYTSILPKPLMPVGSRPVLELLLRWLRRNGSRGIYITTGYLGDLIRAFCGDGRSWDLRGDLAAFSFFGNKNMTTAEGGMVLGVDAELLARVRACRAHGMTTSTVQRLHGQGIYDVTALGFNYRMTELSAALGLVQLQKLAGWNARRKELSRRYRQALDGSDIVTPFTTPRRSTHHIFPVLLPESADRGQIVSALRQEGIQTSFHYPPIHLLSWYRARARDERLPVTEKFSSRELTLPLHPKMEDTDVERVTGALKRIVRGEPRRDE